MILINIGIFVPKTDSVPFLNNGERSVESFLTNKANRQKAESQQEARFCYEDFQQDSGHGSCTDDRSGNAAGQRVCRRMVGRDQPDQGRELHDHRHG